MEEIRRQVVRVRRRLVAAQFLRVATWSLFAGLGAALIGILIPKFWPLSVAGPIWTYGWLGGGVVFGLLVATVWTYSVRQRELDAAIELDRRFGLKERISSVLALDARERETEMGRALVADATRRVGTLDVREKFRFEWNWYPLLPVLTAAAAFLFAVLLEDASTQQQASASTQTSPEVRKQIQKSTETLKKQFERKKKEAEAKGLKEAETLFTKLEKGLEDMNRKSPEDRKQALVRINDLAKELSQRRDELANTDKLRQQLEQLKDVERGPADKLAQAVKEGDFQKALAELQKLQKELRESKLTDEQRQQLAKQLEQMQTKLQQMADAHDQAKRDLEKMIQQKKQAGDLAAAGELQRKLDALSQQNASADRLRQMADKLGKSSETMSQGDAKQAAAELEELAQQLNQMQGEMDELESLSDAMEQIADAKSAMNCQSCEGEGCPECQAAGQTAGMAKGDKPGRGLGEGEGVGARPEEETETGSYESRVAGKPQQGEVYRAGKAAGKNLPGASQEAIKEEIASSLSDESDPLENARLPRRERDHAKEYFERLRKGDVE